MPFQKGNKINVGRVVSQATREKISKRLMGHPVPNDQRKRQSEARKGKYIGNKAGHWLGDDVGYWGLHDWVTKCFPKTSLCQDCNIRTPDDLACVTGVYNRQIENWKWLCHKCHMLRDGITQKLMLGGMKTRFRKGSIPWNKKN